MFKLFDYVLDKFDFSYEIVSIYVLLKGIKLILLYFSVDSGGKKFDFRLVDEGVKVFFVRYEYYDIVGSKVLFLFFIMIMKKVWSRKFLICFVFEK